MAWWRSFFLSDQMPVFAGCESSAAALLLKWWLYVALQCFILTNGNNGVLLFASVFSAMLTKCSVFGSFQQSHTGLWMRAHVSAVGHGPT